MKLGELYYAMTQNGMIVLRIEEKAATLGGWRGPLLMGEVPNPSGMAFIGEGRDEQKVYQTADGWYFYLHFGHDEDGLLTWMAYVLTENDEEQETLGEPCKVTRSSPYYLYDAVDRDMAEVDACVMFELMVAAADQD